MLKKSYHLFEDKVLNICFRLFAEKNDDNKIRNCTPGGYD